MRASFPADMTGVGEQLVAETDNTRVYRVRWSVAPGVSRDGALKMVKASGRDPRREADNLRAEADRLARLWRAGDRLVPEPVAFGAWRDRASLLMEWVDGVTLEDRLVQQAVEPGRPAQVAALLERTIQLLERVHTDLRVTCPDFKENAVLLTGGEARFIDWNRVGPDDPTARRRDLETALRFAGGLVKGRRLYRVDEVAEAVEAWRRGSRPHQLVAELLRDATGHLASPDVHGILRTRARNVLAWCQRFQRSPEQRALLEGHLSQGAVLTDRPLLLPPLEAPVGRAPSKAQRALDAWHRLFAVERSR